MSILNISHQISAISTYVWILSVNTRTNHSNSIFPMYNVHNIIEVCFSYEYYVNERCNVVRTCQISKPYRFIK